MPSSSRYGCLTCCLASDCFGALKGMNQQPLETLQQHQSPTAGAAISVTKTLTRLLAIPANRSCADCKSALVDSSQVHASYSPDLATTEKPKKTAVNHHFWRNHAAFAPPTELGKLHSLRNHIPSLKDLPVDPAITAASQKLCGHGVFVCALCAAAHKLLSANTTCVKAVMDITNWTAEDVQLLQAAGGNAKATSVLEAYYCKPSSALTRIALRPTAKSSIEDRLTFIRAKYEALAFVLPPFGPLAEDAWQKIVSQHPEWSGLWGADLKSLSSLELAESGTQSRARKDGDLLSSVMLGQHAKQRSATELPNRLVDFFCVVTPSDYLHPEVLRQDLSTAAPEDMLLAPHISDCFPAADSYDSNGDNECNTFPEHVSTFVFPDGCRASTMALPPTFFTFVLTNAAGERLYGGALRIYDDDRDTVETLSRVLLNSNYPASLWPSWLPPPAQAYRSSSLPHLNPSKSMSRPNLQSTRNLTLGSANVTSDVVFLPKCLVILSHYPFFDLWRKFLLQLYRIALTEAPLPIERFVANFGT